MGMNSKNLNADDKNSDINFMVTILLKITLNTSG